MKEKLDNQDVYKVAEKLYKHINPTSRMETPNSVYMTVGKWYAEYSNKDVNISFYDWCIINKQPK